MSSIIERPCSNGYCLKCENNQFGKCTKYEVYGKPVPVFGIKVCRNFSDKTNPKDDNREVTDNV